MSENKTTETNDFTALEEQLNDLRDNVESALGTRGVKDLTTTLKKICEQWDNDINGEEEKELNKKIFEAFCDFFHNTGADEVILHLKDDDSCLEDVYFISDVGFDGDSVTLFYSTSEQHSLN